MSENSKSKTVQSGPGRPGHDPRYAVRPMKLRATDEEWAKFLELKPVDTREAFTVLLTLLHLSHTDLAVMTAISKYNAQLQKEAGNG